MLQKKLRGLISIIFKFNIQTMGALRMAGKKQDKTDLKITENKQNKTVGDLKVPEKLQNKFFQKGLCNKCGSNDVSKSQFSYCNCGACNHGNCFPDPNCTTLLYTSITYSCKKCNNKWTIQKDYALKTQDKIVSDLKVTETIQNKTLGDLKVTEKVQNKIEEKVLCNKCGSNDVSKTQFSYCNCGACNHGNCFPDPNCTNLLYTSITYTCKKCNNRWTI